MITAVIPFRAGSKGLPGKNVRQCAGMPLWWWSLPVVGSSVDLVIITTDYEVGEQCSFIRHVKRPPRLATDTASLDEAIIHAIDEVGLADNDVVVTLQPTVPVRREGLIDDCVRCFLGFPAAKSLVTANRLHFVWAGDAGLHINPPRVNRQAMNSGQVLYEEDGSVFVCRSGDLRRSRSRVMDPVILIETPRTVDIDTEEDFALAEYLLERQLATRRAEQEDTRTVPS